jgi:hypothetical protein
VSFPGRNPYDRKGQTAIGGWVGNGHATTAARASSAPVPTKRATRLMPRPPVVMVSWPCKAQASGDDIASIAHGRRSALLAISIAAPIRGALGGKRRKTFGGFRRAALAGMALHEGSQRLARKTAPSAL